MLSLRTHALLVAPKFNPHSFWSYEGACEVLGAKYSAAPLGLITLAALLPREWDLRLVNRNTEELTESDLAWAEIVMTGGMLSQQFDTLRIIDQCRARNLPVVVGGPDVTSSPQIYVGANFSVLGEAEGVIEAFIAAWKRGERTGVFEAAKFKTEITKTPIPRFDLLKFEQYLFVGVQFSRGCPFTCEFCDIIELYGRNPRVKLPAQMLAELDRLYMLGYRGHVDFVDDNLIGNKKAVKEFLPHLIQWQKAHGYPFMFSTEASLNIADDPALMSLMRDANFFGVFAGIESPDPDTLRQTSKKQNLKRDISVSIHRIYAHGMMVMPGLILGFDSESESVVDTMMSCLEAGAMPMALVSLLYALPGTQLTRRLAMEGRLYKNIGVDLDRRQGDFTLAGLNFETRRPRAEILRDFAEILRQIYDSERYFARARQSVLLTQRIKLPWWVCLRDAWLELPRFVSLMIAVTQHRPDIRSRAWRLVFEVLLRNPRAVRNAASLVVFYYYLVPLTRIWISEARRQMEAMDHYHPTMEVDNRLKI